MTGSALSATRLTIFAVVVAAIVGGAGAYVYLIYDEASSASPGPPRLAADEVQLRRVKEARQAAHVAFRDLTPGPTYGRLAFASLDAVASRVVSALPCNRVHFSETFGLCLAITTSPAGFRGLLIDEALQVTRSIELPGMPSRTRVSSNGQLAAYTVFVAGDSYLSAGLSTRTRLVEPGSATVLGDLESFAVTRDGRPFHAVDFNFWGVTFTRDAQRFYATLATGGRILLVEGDAAARTLRVMAEDIECPSLSPDGTHIAFKKRFGSGFDAWWQPAVVDLATMTVRLLPESKRIDDQIEWLDDAHVLYAVGHSTSSTMRRADVWKTAIDGSSPPTVFLADAESPAVVRP